MLRNFHMAAIRRQGDNFDLLQIPLHQPLQESLAEEWDRQSGDFLFEVDEIDFDAGYQPEPHERFRLRDYRPPPQLAHLDSHSIHELPGLSGAHDVSIGIAGIVGFARNAQGDEVMLFQNFTKSRVVEPGRFLFLEKGVFRSQESAALTLDTHIGALYLPKERSLWFRSFRTVNTFLPLEGYFEEASKPQILDTLSHSRLYPEDARAVASYANQWFRKRFAMLAQSEVLDRFSTQEIVRSAQHYQINIKTKLDRIVFPAAKADAKRLLQFLNEEIFRGALTDTIYETNSKREVG